MASREARRRDESCSNNNVQGAVDRDGQLHTSFFVRSALDSGGINPYLPPNKQGAAGTAQQANIIAKQRNTAPTACGLSY